MAQLALGIVGGVIGFYVGGPAGAQLGFAIGYGIGAYAFPPDGPTVEGPRLRDLTSQAGAEGKGINVIYGTMRVQGEQLWSENILETRHEEEVGGKGGGGGGQTQITYSYSCTFAVGFCEGPILGIRRMWADSKLIYSITEDASSPTFAANAARGVIRFYQGTETQVADTSYAAFVGAADAPAFRGQAYAVFDTYQLADFGNRKPFIEAEVVTVGAREYPNRQHVISGNTFSLYQMDPRRRLLLTAKTSMFSGDQIYRWDGGDTAPSAYAAITEDLLTNCVGLGYDQERDEYVLLRGFPNVTEIFERFDAATGASLGQTSESVTGNAPGGSTESLELRNQIHYDPERQGFWTTADGFSTGDLYLVFLDSFHGDWDFVHVSTTNGLNTGPHNHQDLIDSDGNVWIVAGDSILLCDQAFEFYPATIVESPNDGFIPQSAFFWAARDEIWIARENSHASSGWHVFNVVTRTFDNSVSLLGDWTKYFVHGVQNVYGYAWFITEAGVVGDQVSGQLRRADGVLIQEMDEAFNINGELVSIYYTPGIIFMQTEAGNVQSFYEDAIPKNYWRLDEVVDDVCDRAGVVATDSSDLRYDTVRGAVIPRPMPGRRFLEPLTAAYAFDMFESDGAVKSVKRGGASIATLTDDDLGAYQESASGDGTERVVRQRLEETELPATIYVSFQNEALDYNIGVARARREVTFAANVLNVELPLALTSAEGHQIADSLMRFAWLERTRFSFTLPPAFRTLEPTDVVTMPDSSRVRLIKVEYASNGVVKCEGVNDDQGAPISYAVGNDDEVGTGNSLGGGGPTTGIVLDIPLLLDQHNDEGVYIGAAAESDAWPGALWFYSKDSGVTWQTVTPAGSQAKIGVVLSGEMVISTDGRTWDLQSEITVKLTNPSLALESAASDDTFYQGANAFVIGDGEDWEVAQFYDATENADGTFTLSRFLRGRRGTEHLIPRGWGATSRFVLLEAPEILRAPVGLELVGVTTLWKAVTIGSSIDDEIADEEEFNAVSCLPYSPVEVGGARQPSGEYHFQWTRRARKRAEWRNGGDVPLDETTEAYELEIWDKYFETLYRTVEISEETTYEYTNALQATDVGSPSPDALGIAVYQMSDRVGRGYVGRGTVPVGSGHRYWRIKDITLNGGTFFEISEFHLYRSTTREDASATLSASDETSFGVVAAWQDNSTSTRCHWPVATAQASTFWVQWDFGFKAEITGIRWASFSVEATRIPVSLTLQFSDDGEDWLDAGSITGMTYPGTSSFTEVFRIPTGGA